MSNTTFSNKRSTTLPVVLPISWIDRLTQLARERGINRSALVREMLQKKLFANEETALPSDKEA
ncbi:MAG: hypothetical protein NMNS01_25960 [Nitrosomonas sp.]|nr:MAG: hypothetical protein NMNS01_25960 [Nitrosomonas sp.]